MDWRECEMRGCKTPATMVVHGCSQSVRGASLTAEYCEEHAEMASRSDFVGRVERIEEVEP